MRLCVGVHFNDLHTAVSHPPRRIGNLNVSDEESSGRVDYAIKKLLVEFLEEIICITKEGVAQNLMQCRGVSDVKFLSFHFVHTLNIVVVIDKP